MNDDETICVYALVLHIPVEQIPALKRFLMESSGTTIIFQKMSGGKLYITENPPWGTQR